MVEECKETARRSGECPQADRLDRLERMILGSEGWMAYQKMVIKELETNSERLNDVIAQQHNMIANQSAMEMELKSLKKTSAQWGGGLGAFLGALAAAVWHFLGGGTG